MSSVSSRAGIALGSNLGDRLSFLRSARSLVCAQRFVIPPILQSPIFETNPIDCPPGAENFFNAVIEVGCTIAPRDFLSALRGIERELGRPAVRARNAARTIDLDLLYFGDEAMETEELELPHPRLREREFVLRPLALIRPELRLPGEAATVSELLALRPIDSAVEQRYDEW